MQDLADADLKPHIWKRHLTYSLRNILPQNIRYDYDIGMTLDHHELTVSCDDIESQKEIQYYYRF